MDEKIAELEQRIETLEKKQCECRWIKRRDPSVSDEEMRKRLEKSILRAFTNPDDRKPNDDIGEEST